MNKLNNINSIDNAEPEVKCSIEAIAAALGVQSLRDLSRNSLGNITILNDRTRMFLNYFSLQTAKKPSEIEGKLCGFDGINSQANDGELKNERTKRIEAIEFPIEAYAKAYEKVLNKDFAFKYLDVKARLKQDWLAATALVIYILLSVSLMILYECFDYFESSYIFFFFAWLANTYILVFLDDNFIYLLGV